MAALILPRRFTQQPTSGPLAVNEAHPLANNLAALGTIVNGRPYEVKGNGILAPAGTTGLAVVGGHQCATTGSGSTDVWSGSFRTLLPGQNAVSVIVRAYSATVSTARKRLIRLSNATNGTIVAIDYGNGTFNRISASIQVTGSTFPARDASVGYTNTANKLEEVCFTRSGTAMELYLDGAVLPGASSSASSNDLIGIINQIFVGNSSSGFPLRGGVAYWSLWNIALSAAQVAELYRNPWHLFKSYRQVLYFDVGGGTGDTPSAADSGTLTLTGSAADGLRALLSAADASSLALTGSAANGVRALSGIADAGSLTLTGSAADALLARLGVADSGSLTLTGSAADALRALAGVAGSGSITLTGSDAAGVYTPVGDTPSAADSGSLTLTGSAAVGTYDCLAAADSGSLTLTGADAAGQIQAPGAYTSDADAGSLTLLGYDANGVFAGAVTLTQADLDAIAAAVWADPVAVAAHAKLDAIIARITC